MPVFFNIIMLATLSISKSPSRPSVNQRDGPSGGEKKRESERQTSWWEIRGSRRIRSISQSVNQKTRKSSTTQLGAMWRLHIYNKKLCILRTGRQISIGPYDGSCAHDISCSVHICTLIYHHLLKMPCTLILSLCCMDNASTLCERASNENSSKCMHMRACVPVCIAHRTSFIVSCAYLYVCLLCRFVSMQSPAHLSVYTFLGERQTNTR